MEEIKKRLGDLEERVGKLEAKKKRTKGPPKKPMTDEEWMAGIKANATYTGIDIEREYGKMIEWCKVRPGVQPTRRRFINWLNREDKPLLGRAPEDRYQKELGAALKDPKNLSLPGCNPPLSAGAKAFFYSFKPPIHWRELQRRVLNGEDPFASPLPIPAAPDFKAKAAGDG